MKLLLEDDTGVTYEVAVDIDRWDLRDPALQKELLTYLQDTIHEAQFTNLQEKEEEERYERDRKLNEYPTDD